MDLIRMATGLLVNLESLILNRFKIRDSEMFNGSGCQNFIPCT